MTENAYVLGHVDAELQRLLMQGRLHRDFTEYALRRAGLRPGMRVLDVGCGPGDVSFIAARLVGRAGAVLGVDASPEAIELARTRAARQGLTTVHFETATLPDVLLHEPVDALIGRLILMHLPDPTAALRQLAGIVRSGGVVAFCEIDTSTVHAVPELPLLQTVKDAICKTLSDAGFDPAFGGNLHTLFRSAGLGTPRLAFGAPIAPIGAADEFDILTYVIETWRSLLPVAQSLGQVPAELADPDSLLRRLRQDAADADGIAVMPALIAAWTQVS